MTGALLVLWAAAVPLIFSPGPANISLASVGIAYGFKRSVPYLIGIILGTTTVLLLVALGATAIILTHPLLKNLLGAIAALYIVYLAWKIASAPLQNADPSSARPPTMTPGLILALANPKAFAAIGAIYAGQTLVEDHALTDAISKVTALTPVIILSAAGWLTFGSFFSNALSHPRIGRAVNIAFSLALVASVAMTLMP